MDETRQIDPEETAESEENGASLETVETAEPVNSGEIPEAASSDEPCADGPVQELPETADEEGSPSEIPSGPNTETPPESSPADELAALRAEIASLRTELLERQSAMERMGRECEEFRTLYPDVSLSSLPDEVWEDVRKGVPVAAAFALSQRRKFRALEQADATNRENAVRSAGELRREKPGYFSPDEVRSMSQAEVRKNYQNILLSMQKWR